MKLFEAFKRKQKPGHDRDAFQPPKKENDMLPGEAAQGLSDDRRSSLLTLTPREYDLFLLLLEGYTLKESAKQMSVKYSTANTHMTAIYKKLKVNSRAELIIKYYSTGKKNNP